MLTPDFVKEFGVFFIAFADTQNEEFISHFWIPNSTG